MHTCGAPGCLLLYSSWLIHCRHWAPSSTWLEVSQAFLPASLALILLAFNWRLGFSLIPGWFCAHPVSEGDLEPLDLFPPPAPLTNGIAILCHQSQLGIKPNGSCMLDKRFLGWPPFSLSLPLLHFQPTGGLSTIAVGLFLKSSPGGARLTLALLHRSRDANGPLGQGRALAWCCCGPLPTEVGGCALASRVLAGNPPPRRTWVEPVACKGQRVGRDRIPQLSYYLKLRT